MNLQDDCPRRAAPRRMAGLLVALAVAGVLSGCTAIQERLPGAVSAGDGPALTATGVPVQAEIVPSPTPRVVSTPNPGGGAAVTASGKPLSLGSRTYNGEITAASVVPVVAQAAGQIVELNVKVGDHVKKDDVLLRVDPSVFEAQLAQAQAALQLAQSQLELATQQPKETDLKAAESGVKAARAAYNRALQGATEEDKRMVQAQLKQAEAAVKIFQAQYDRIAGDPFAGMMPESLQLEQGTLALEAARAGYDKLLKGATADQIAGAYAQLTGAEAQLARLKRGAEPAQIKAAEAGVKQAEVAVYLAQLQLDKAAVKAPADGFAYKVDAVLGGMTAPTAPTPPVILFSEDVKILVPIEETRSQEVRVGQPVTIRVDAFPDRIFQGVIAEIAPTFDHATRTVQVTVRPQGEGAADLAPGMFATVELGAAEAAQ
jgi:multidrug resistance efflux pump